MRTRHAIALVAANAAFGASMVFGLATVAHADSDVDYPQIVIDSQGQVRDCTVRDQFGNRADFDQACNAYWQL